MNYRHGDLALIEIDKLPEGLVESKTDELMRGSNNNPHKFVNGRVFFKNVSQFIFGYFVAEKNCVLRHKEHGVVVESSLLREAPIKEGIYELRRQCEDTHDGMKQVVD